MPALAHLCCAWTKLTLVESMAVLDDGNQTHENFIYVSVLHSNAFTLLEHSSVLPFLVLICYIYLVFFTYSEQGSLWFGYVRPSFNGNLP